VNDENNSSIVVSELDDDKNWIMKGYACGYWSGDGSLPHPAITILLFSLVFYTILTVAYFIPK
jgi:hypothetical protein